MTNHVPDPQQMTPQARQAWMEAYWRFRETRPRLIKKAAIYAAGLLFMPLMFFFSYGSELLSEFLKDSLNMTHLLLLPLLFVQVSFWTFRFDHGWTKSPAGEDAFQLSFRHLGVKEVRALLGEYVSKLLQDVSRSSEGLPVLLLWVAGIPGLIWAFINQPNIVAGFLLFIGVLIGWGLLEWYIWLSPVEAFRAHLEKADATHIRGAQVIEMPDASCSSPNKDPNDAQ